MSRGTRAAVALAFGLACLNLSGCLFISSETPPPVQRPNTIGKELRDLRVARDDGAVSDDEYRSAKQRLLSSYDRR